MHVGKKAPLWDHPMVPINQIDRLTRLTENFLHLILAALSAGGKADTVRAQVMASGHIL